MDKDILKELGIEDVGALTAEDIATARPKVLEAGRKAIEAKDVARAEALAELADTLAARKTELDAKAAEDADKLTKAAAKFTEPEPAKEPEPEPAKAEEVKPAEPAKAAEKPAEKPAEPAKVEPAAVQPEVQPATPEPAPMPVAAASVPMPKPPAANAPVTPKAIVASITAASGTNDLTAGSPIKDIGVLASMAANQMQVMTSNPSLTGKFPIANLMVEYPKDRQLGRDASESTAKIESILADARAETSETLRKLARMRTDDLLDLGVTADGGLCAPLNVSYDVFSVGTTLRPIQGALARFSATRGGIRFMTSPTLADVAGEGAGASVLVITEAQDAAGSTNKPCLVLTCGEEIEEKVDAVTKCVQIGNWSYLSYRERFDEQWKLVGVHHAREAELNLWNRLVTNSTALTGVTPVLGMSRDVTNQLVRRAAKKRSLHRTAKDAPIRLIAPDILFEMFAEDRRNQLPGDSAVATAEAEFRRELAMHNIALTLSPDIEIAGVQAEGELDAWPTSLEFLMFFEGTHIYLDMGRLDFGLFRDSVLNESNNLRVMEETFEGIATPGFDSDHITLEVCPSGATSGTVEVPCTLS